MKKRSQVLAGPHPCPHPCPPHIEVLTAGGLEDYALRDSGAGRKLERFGPILLDRPEPQALWQPRLDKGTWAEAHAVFTSAEDGEKGRWRFQRPVPSAWPLRLSGITLMMKLASFHHPGVFPEQAPHWLWLIERLRRREGDRERGGRPRLLNLFAYTGAASLLAAVAGAEVTHVDASRKAVAWARENQAASGLADAPIRWIVEDARKFTAREVRRGRSYHAILADPPKFGRGPENEVWDLFLDLPGLLEDCRALLAAEGMVFLLTVYAIRASALAFGQLCQEKFAGFPGHFHSGELVIEEEGGGRLLPTSLFTRWERNPLTIE